MGEVYRADDLTLGQVVALKFLPPALAADQQRVQKLLDEVRITRQVSHPNVCRVYDVHTIAGSPDGTVPPTIFLAMEFIDGEDLGSLLRRIGRLPHDKALEVARQLCAGLAAAHEQGVVHRDLKPSNIMIDGRGRARLTDFGIAGPLADIIAAGDLGAGTPTYMSPEQLNAQGVSVRSDIYALGLVLFELFTGKPVFRASTMAELRGLHATSDPTRPSTHTPDIDPLTERVILRCLEKDPAFRPASALAVSAALPGGDPLAAALAAGETPTPEMVAASGGSGAVPVKYALTCVAVFLAALLAVVAMKDHFGMVRRTPFAMSGEVLRSKAQEFLSANAPPPKRHDSASGFTSNSQVINNIDANLKGPDRWASLETGRPSGIIFWYRYAPGSLAPQFNSYGLTGPNDPVAWQRGSAMVWLDSMGRLLEFRGMPELADRPPDPLAPALKPEKDKPDWAAFFTAAGLDITKFKPAEPRLAASFATDSRLAWTGEWPTESPFSPIPIRVDAASFEGKPVTWAIVAAWHVASAPDAPNWLLATVGGVSGMVDAITTLFALTAAPLIAWRHARSGRGDRRGAFRIGLFMFVATMIMCGLRMASPFRVNAVFFGNAVIADAVWKGLFAWILYMALEPIIRKIAPWAIIGWTRLIQGKFTDPVVGRDVMIGTTLSACVTVLYHASAFLPNLIGQPPPAPFPPSWFWLGGMSATIASLAQGFGNAVFVPLFVTLLMVGLKWVLRRDSWAIIALWFIGTMMIGSEFGFIRYALFISAIIALGYAVALVRYGLLTMAATFLTSFTISGPPASLDLSAWYAPSWMIPYAVVIAVALTAAYFAAGGRAAISAWHSAKQSIS